MTNKLFKFLLVTLDVILIGLAFYLAFALRFGFEIPKKYYDVFQARILFVIFFKLAVFYLFGYYQLLWRHASLREVIESIKVIAVSSLGVVFALFAVQSQTQFPRSVVFMDLLLTFSLVGGSRLLIRVVEEASPKFRTDKEVLAIHEKNIKNIVIIGAGEAGSMLVKKMLKYPAYGYRPVAFIDDNEKKLGFRISGIPVIGTTDHLKQVTKEFEIQEVILAIPSASGETRKKIAFLCEELSIPCKTTPSIAELVHSDMDLSSIRQLQVEDILGRDPITVDLKNLSSSISNKTVVITGAAGSIGSELCRQINHLLPAKLIALDISENGLYCLKQTIREEGVDIVYRICDIKDKRSIDNIFEKHRPDVVFHAAAYKHVPLMEDHPAEAINNNLFGVKTVADSASEHGVGSFILISTDKAVDPANIMGYSKALAEKYIQCLSKRSQTKCTIVRFGNVLGSSGSVVPLFQTQIQKMGPVTVTHPQMTRYFMTVQEAVQLVVQAGAMGESGQLFVLDMGDPVAIKELAENMIRLAGYEPYVDIDLKFIGLRPGEKMHEELFWEHEQKMKTNNNKIFIAQTSDIDIDMWRSQLTKIMELADSGDIIRMQRLLSQLFNQDVDEPDVVMSDIAEPDMSKAKKVSK